MVPPVDPFQGGGVFDLVQSSGSTPVCLRDRFENIGNSRSGRPVGGVSTSMRSKGEARTTAQSAVAHRQVPPNPREGRSRSLSSTSLYKVATAARVLSPRSQIGRSNAATMMSRPNSYKADSCDAGFSRPSTARSVLANELGRAAKPSARGSLPATTRFPTGSGLL